MPAVLEQIRNRFSFLFSPSEPDQLSDEPMEVLIQRADEKLEALARRKARDESVAGGDILAAINGAGRTVADFDKLVSIFKSESNLETLKADMAAAKEPYDAAVAQRDAAKAEADEIYKEIGPKMQRGEALLNWLNFTAPHAINGAKATYDAAYRRHSQAEQSIEADLAKWRSRGQKAAPVVSNASGGNHSGLSAEQERWRREGRLPKPAAVGASADFDDDDEDLEVPASREGA
jgi:hypothetical protein